jgi:hypothetical protein
VLTTSATDSAEAIPDPWLLNLPANDALRVGRDLNPSRLGQAALFKPGSQLYFPTDSTTSGNSHQTACYKQQRQKALAEMSSSPGGFCISPKELSEIMSTPAQIEANRVNAQHSTGPVTEEGKSRSSQNRFQHGFCGRFKVVDPENQEDFDNLCQALRDEHHPATPTEHMLVDRMAQHYWLSQRAQVLQDHVIAECPLLAHEQKALSLYLRYQTTHERAFSKCLNDLLKLRAERRKQEIGFERQKQQAAEAARKQEAHEAKIRAANARTAEQKQDKDIEEAVETRLPGHTVVQSSPSKDVLPIVVGNFAAELDADPKLAKMLKAA